MLLKIAVPIGLGGELGVDGFNSHLMGSWLANDRTDLPHVLVSHLYLLNLKEMYYKLRGLH